MPGFRRGGEKLSSVVCKLAFVIIIITTTALRGRSSPASPRLRSTPTAARMLRGPTWDGTADLAFLESRGYMAELFSGDRLRSIDAAVPHQLFAPRALCPRSCGDVVGLSVARAGTRDGQALPDRLLIAPQLPAGWGYLRVRNVRFRGATVDLDLTRDEFGISVAAVPRWGTVPLELQATMAPGATPQKARTTKGWKPLGPQDGASRPPDVAFRRDSSSRRSSRSSPCPASRCRSSSLPLQLGDMSSRLRIIDAWVEGKTYKLKVEGRRGRSYQLRMFIPFKLTTMELPNEIPSQPGVVPTVRTIMVEMPPAEPGSSGAVLKRSDWATKVIAIPLGGRLR